MPTSLLCVVTGLGVITASTWLKSCINSLSEEQNIYQSSTARAMFYGALTTASSLSAWLFRHNQGIASMDCDYDGCFLDYDLHIIVLPAL